MICTLSKVGYRCSGKDIIDNCTVLHPNATLNNVRKGSCTFLDIRAPKIPRVTARKRNPIKASKAKARG